ncbi:hypothetical protein EIP86_000644 [Pleurotus ostreatoroseus]|nr:hypothetical protein EIP86_000644 [Pleurotus ostreatoroseus]
MPGRWMYLRLVLDPQPVAQTPQTASLQLFQVTAPLGPYSHFIGISKKAITYGF